MTLPPIWKLINKYIYADQLYADILKHNKVVWNNGLQN